LNYDQAATLALLGALKDGDKPLEPGDVFHHPRWSRKPTVILEVAGHGA
jgi:hypothetical protein